MSASNEYWAWHLTPQGWVEGSEKLDSGTIERPVPEDTVLTLTYHEIYASIYSSPDRRIEQKIINQTKADILKTKYGSTPKKMNYFKPTRVI